MLRHIMFIYVVPLFTHVRTHYMHSCTFHMCNAPVHTCPAHICASYTCDLMWHFAATCSIILLTCTNSFNNDSHMIAMCMPYHSDTSCVSTTKPLLLLPTLPLTVIFVNDRLICDVPYLLTIITPLTRVQYWSL